MKMPKRSGVDSEIPTASMADIAFLLIVFFMVTTTFAATKGLDFKLPKDEEGTPPVATDEEQAVYIHVTPAGVSVDCNPMEVSEILGYLKPKLDAWRDKPVILHTDLNAEYRDMVQVYATFAARGRRGEHDGDPSLW